MLPFLAGGAALGFLKNKLVDKPAEGRSRKMNAEIMRYSPWTGMQAPGVKEAGSAFGSMLQGAALGASAAPGLAGLMGGGGASALSAPAMAANAGTSPLAAAPAMAAPAVPTMGQEWFNLSNPQFPYKR